MASSDFPPPPQPPAPTGDTGSLLMIMASGAAMAALAADAITPEHDGRSSEPPPIIAGDTPLPVSQPAATSAEPVLYRLSVTVAQSPDTQSTPHTITPTLAVPSNVHQATFRPTGSGGQRLASTSVSTAALSKAPALGEEKARHEPAAAQTETEPAAAALDPRDAAFAARGLEQAGSGDVSKARQDAHPSETKVTGHEDPSTSRVLTPPPPKR
jgi:hypothetical protein